MGLSGTGAQHPVATGVDLRAVQPQAHQLSKDIAQNRPVCWWHSHLQATRQVVVLFFVTKTANLLYPASGVYGAKFNFKIMQEEQH